MQLLKFSPLYKERVWGGRDLEAKMGRQLPAGKRIGESWELVDRENEQSLVESGPQAGKSLREIMEKDADALLGPGRDGQKPFPILVKWLDCRERLSLQVHPPADIAPELGGQPKTENWYIADCAPGASLIVGLKQGVTREQFTQSLENSEAEGCVHRFPVRLGDSILVESGRMHAIDGGNLILEIQQNSDTTYRVYDWGRLGLDGKPREMHIEESLKSINFEDFEPQPLRAVPGKQTLAECPEFRIRKFNLLPGAAPLDLPSGHGARLIHVIKGQVSDASSGRQLQAGETYLQPHVCGTKLTSATHATVLVTDRF